MDLRDPITGSLHAEEKAKLMVWSLYAMFDVVHLVALYKCTYRILFGNSNSLVAGKIQTQATVAVTEKSRQSLLFFDSEKL